jgi:hypothetical protein
MECAPDNLQCFSRQKFDGRLSGGIFHENFYVREVGLGEEAFESLNVLNLIE